LIAILDYGSGNLRSAERAFALAGQEVVVTSDPEICLSAAGLVVPGVGAFKACMNQLLDMGGDEIVLNCIRQGVKVFGICVGMQILFTTGLEKSISSGLGIWPGSVSQISASILPHIGWNTVTAPKDSILFEGITDQYFYFVHSYAAKDPIVGGLNSICKYGENFLAAVETESVVATQFHPEKSGSAGARLITNWVNSL
jgi:glutamine amidotransferase